MFVDGKAQLGAATFVKGMFVFKVVRALVKSALVGPSATGAPPNQLLIDLSEFGAFVGPVRVTTPGTGEPNEVPEGTVIWTANLPG